MQCIAALLLAISQGSKGSLRFQLAKMAMLRWLDLLTRPVDGSPVCMNAVGGDFDFGNATKGEQKLYEVFGWLFRSLFHNVANSVGDRSLEHYTLGLQASKVRTHELAGLEHDSCTRILHLRNVKCKPFPMGKCFSGSSRRNPYLHLNLCEDHERKLGLIR